jgi:hypothetical protein
VIGYGQYINLQLFGHDGKPACCGGMGSLHGYNESFSIIHEIFKPMMQADSSLELTLYTMLKIDDQTGKDNVVTFRSNPLCHVGMEERRDWALFDWGADGHVPGEIICFLDFCDNDVMAYNATVNEEERLGESGKYAMIHSLTKAIPGLMDPSIVELEYTDVMQANSILLFFGKKEMDPSTGQPKTRFVTVDTIVRPLIVIPDFSPSFENNKHSVKISEWNTHAERLHAYTIVRPRDQWHLAYLELAHAYYDKEVEQGTYVEDVSDDEESASYDEPIENPDYSGSARCSAGNHIGDDCDYVQGLRDDPEYDIQSTDETATTGENEVTANNMEQDNTDSDEVDDDSANSTVSVN